MIDDQQSVQLCRGLVSGGIASYPCVLPGGHFGAEAGMHVAVEIPASAERYAVWCATQQVAQAPLAAPSQVPVPPSAPSSAPSPETSVTSPALDASELADPVGREMAQLDRLANLPMAKLPPYIGTVMVFESAATSLAILWAMCQSEFDRGASGVVVTPEFLSRLVTPSVRSLVEALRVQETPKEQG